MNKKQKQYNIYMLILLPLAILLALSLVSGTAFADENENQTEFNQSTCMISEENFTMFPATLDIVVRQNTTVSFSAMSILFGPCDARELIWSGCERCLYSRQDFNQSHGSNLETLVQYYLPALPTNQTNQTIPYAILLSGNNTPQRSINLTVFIPYEVTSVTEVVNLSQPSGYTIGNITEFINALTTEQQLFVALIIDNLLQGYNFSFIRTITNDQQVTVPVIYHIPINVDEYSKWVRECVPSVTAELDAKYKECNEKYDQALVTVESKEQSYQDCKTEKGQFIDRWTSCEDTKKSEVVNLTASAAERENIAYNTLYIGLAIIIVLLVAGWYVRRYYWHGKGPRFDIPGEKSYSVDNENGDEGRKAKLSRIFRQNDDEKERIGVEDMENIKRAVKGGQ